MNRLLIIVIAGMLAGGVHARAQQNSAALDKLFASAQHKATVEGNLKGAIEDYKRIVATAGRDRAAAAKAQLHIAECYRSVGDAAAEKQAYQQIERAFSDQKDALAIARGRLGGSVRNTLVWAAASVDVYRGLGTNARVSRDGRFIAYTDWTTGNLVLRDLSKRSDHKLTTDANIGRSVYAQSSAFSPDGRQIAFSWLSEVTRRYQVRLVSSTAPGEPRVIFDQEDVEWVQPYDWSLDGTRIALQIQRLDRTGQIALLNVEDGTTQVLVSVPWVGPSGEMRFSPDGRYLAFDQGSETDPTDREVFVIPSDGSCCKGAVVEHPADEQVLGWGPTGSELLFWSDRKGPWALWTIGIGSGKALGAARVANHVSIDGAFAPLGLTAAGDVIVASARDVNSGIRTAQVDLSTGRLTSVATDLGIDVANPFKGWTSYAWSPKGRTLAVFRGSATNGGVFSFKDLSTGALRETRAHDGGCPGGMRWSSDEAFFICHGAYTADPRRTGSERRGILRVDASTGKVSYLAAGRAPALSPDNRTIYLLRNDDSRRDLQTILVERQLISGVERELLRRPSLRDLRLSPDGRWLVAITGDARTGTNSLLIASPIGEETREIATTPGAESITGVFWSPDSRSVFAQRSLAKAKPVFIRVTLDGRITAHPELDLGSNVQLHPDGRHVAYSVPKESKVGVHRLEAVVPRAGAKR